MLHVIVTFTVEPLVGVWLPPVNSPMPSKVPEVPLFALAMKAPKRLICEVRVKDAGDELLLMEPLAAAPFGVHVGLFPEYGAPSAQGL